MSNNKKYFKYLDQYIEKPNWPMLHAEVCHGIALSHWHKRFVSSGVLDKFKNFEITPYMTDYEKNLDGYAKQLFLTLKTTDQRLKFMAAYGPVPHPFWIIYLRNNKRIENTGILNKSQGAACHWTDDSCHFPGLVKLIQSMPFSEIGRVIIFMTEANNVTLPHYDDIKRFSRPSDDFVWFTTKPNTKKIFVYDEDLDQKFYPESGQKFIWFDEMNYHGTDSVDHFAFSIRIDGVFLPEIKEKIQ
jgi:hypothetical protein